MESRTSAGDSKNSAASTVDLFARMDEAAQRVRRRLERCTGALLAANVSYALLGGHAVGAWVATVDRGAVRNTPDVDVLIRRADFAAARAAMEAAGFVHDHVAKMDLFLDDAGASPREAVHIVFAGEFVRAGEHEPNPDVSEATDIGPLRVIDLAALVRIKLTAFRRKDQVHLLDMIGVGLIDQSWTARLPAALAARLQELIDTPDG